MKNDVCAIFRANLDLLRQFPQVTQKPTDTPEMIIKAEDLAKICKSYLTPNPRIFKEIQDRDGR